MRKWLLLLMGIMLVASLSHGTYSKSTVHADCNSPLHSAQSSGASYAEYTSTAAPIQVTDLAAAETEKAQQSDRQAYSLSDRILHMVDTFAKLVMVI